MTRAERLDVRLTAVADNDQVIRRAASAAGMSVSAFVVTHARAAAEDVLAGRLHYFLDDDAWQELQRRLSQPPRPRPGLAKPLDEGDQPG